MSKKKSHAATPALKVLEEAGISHSIHLFDGGTDHFGDHAAAAINVEPERIFKTLIVDLSAGKGPKRQLAVAMLPVTHKLSLKKVAASFHATKATMAEVHDAEKSSGYVHGGISALGQKTVLPTVIDETAQLWDTIFFSGGKRGLDIEASADALIEILAAHYADILAE
ncbi:Cys-tRNA(Pro)/Cys-tRNA(Cys) deacylase ybaK [Corynebacterium kutscheri]|uniref:Cys-tRNA(Pro)/Cys-tRNA(Cys) deacylase n=1 Tax=Corynebacterium kutscheri TaxID=35755 RepID=A0A0F6TCI0_9CORY|nr:Cys-tRNA(Pro) deacylase [Corynebacterium kutscheri]AKE40719.1 Cys-tRNA(Pro) deacylase [Corynebacterium kutscheri]VEH04638.1 Cys-tRNA(Pro)/Cys-tRNA(Cys) deacylase ybaK [Corynebacterium kutscheri]VEH11116.1 Cys-tRNA(Pro)/Cys-tRNA(Cys) deacylase ybaK [Corynebacterium kutscheri]VEH80406.1 Cys-tRNA(Pro)/Cys-tRNA(Cys) deacylase ybaK [Corynebacterium kutscheri]